MNLWIVGAGPMATHYAKVLEGLGRPYEVIARGDVSAQKFRADVGISPRRGGLHNVLGQRGAPTEAIVAVGVQDLFKVTDQLIRAGTKRILVEKPGASGVDELAILNDEAAKLGAEVFVAYNRRFFASTLCARDLLELDAGPTSLHFEFTEWSGKIAGLQSPLSLKQRWILANSSHVIDLAFHLGGTPREWSHWRQGYMEWHEPGARYVGAGITNMGALFSYLADWEAPGRWGIEVMTRERRLIMRPLETLSQVRHGSTSIEPIRLSDALDREFKPGLWLQTKAFLEGEQGHLCSLREQLDNAIVYSELAGYGDQV